MKKILSHALCVLFVIMCSSISPFLMFFPNIGSVKLYEIAIISGIFSIIGLIAFIALRFILKSEYKAALAAGLISVLFQHAGRLATLISYKITLVVFVLVAGGLVFAAYKFLKNDLATLLVKVLSCTLAFLFLLNTCLSIGRIADVVTLNSETKNDVNAQYEYLSGYKKKNINADELPNVYFLIVDEYAGFNSLKKYYDYDNAEFKSFLENNNFTISTTSTNYMGQTYECLANVFNLEVSEKNNYLNTSEEYCHKKASNGALFKLAEDAGYTINVAQTNDLVNYKSQTALYGDTWSQDENGDSIISLLTNASMLAPYTNKLRAVLNNVPLEHFTNKDLSNQLKPNIAPLLYFAESENVGKPATFNLCYTNAPHVPFCYDQNGNVCDNTDNIFSWNNKELYLDQLKYSTTLLEYTITNIIENDPDSIIILMSDHGARDHSGEVDGAEWMSAISSKDAADILCAVYYKGKEFTDIEGMCGSNVLISVVNKAWGYEIPLIKQSDDFYFKK